jgi:hypothetical protein
MRRAASAPAVVSATFAVMVGSARLLAVPTAPAGGWQALLRNLSRPVDDGATLPMLTGASVAVLVLWAFLAGGVLDRFARNRPTRGPGFFGACGAHFPAILRLDLFALILCAGAAWLGSRLPAAITIALVLLVNLVTDYARVRIVVEDRRSALGAVLAGVRFVRRNGATAGLYILNGALVLGAGAAYHWVRELAASADWMRWLLLGSCLVLLHYLRLSVHAAEIALFQSRLAHASYTAGPPLEWPESPAAEAIANGAPRPTP